MFLSSFLSYIEYTFVIATLGSMDPQDSTFSNITSLWLILTKKQFLTNFKTLLYWKVTYDVISPNIPKQIPYRKTNTTNIISIDSQSSRLTKTTKDPEEPDNKEINKTKMFQEFNTFVEWYETISFIDYNKIQVSNNQLLDKENEN